MATITPYFAGQRITAAALNGLLPGAWTPPTALGSGWTAPAGFQTMQFRYLNPVTVQIVAWMEQSAATTGAAINWATMPFATVSDQRGIVFVQASGATAYTVGQARMATTNAMTVYGTSGANSVYYLNWILPLDL